MQDAMFFKDRAEFGLVAGWVSSIVVIIAMYVLQLLGLMSAPWFLLIGTLFGGAGLPVDIAIYGIAWHFGLGLLWGFIFASAFKRYTETKGLALGGIQLLLIGGALAVIPTPQLQGTLISIPLVNALELVLDLIVAYIAWGLTIGFLGKKYLQHLNIGTWGPGWLHRVRKPTPTP